MQQVFCFLACSPPPQIQLGHFVPVLVLFVQAQRTERGIGNVTTAQNWYAETTLTGKFK